MQQNVPTAGLRPALTPILSGRVTLLGIDERSSGLDLVLAGIFVTMRGASGRSLPELARILKTEPEILLHLEAGRVRALPPWHEISRLVTDYGQFIEIDIQPVLSRIREQTGEKSAPLRATDQRAQPVPAAAITAPHHQPRAPGVAPSDRGIVAADKAVPVDATVGDDEATASAPSHLERMADKLSGRPALQPGSEHAATFSFGRLRTICTGSTVALLVAGLLWTAQSQSPQFFAAVDQLPPGLVKSIRQNLERLTQRAAQSRDGLQWIETSDPRSRKADKLPVLSQGDKKGG